MARPVPRLAVSSHASAAVAGTFVGAGIADLIGADFEAQLVCAATLAERDDAEQAAMMAQAGMARSSYRFVLRRWAIWNNAKRCVLPNWQSTGSASSDDLGAVPVCEQDLWSVTLVTDRRPD